MRARTARAPVHIGGLTVPAARRAAAHRYRRVTFATAWWKVHALRRSGPSAAKGAAATVAGWYRCSADAAPATVPELWLLRGVLGATGRCQGPVSGRGRRVAASPAAVTSCWRARIRRRLPAAVPARGCEAVQSARRCRCCQCLAAARMPAVTPGRGCLQRVAARSGVPGGCHTAPSAGLAARGSTAAAPASRPGARPLHRHLVRGAARKRSPAALALAAAQPAFPVGQTRPRHVPTCRA